MKAAATLSINNGNPQENKLEKMKIVISFISCFIAGFH
jgi:hypothetical protein